MKKIRRNIRPYIGYILSGSLIVGSILIGVFLLIPGIQKTLLLRKQIQTFATEIESLRGKATLLQSLDETKLAQDLKELTVALPAESSVVSIFSTLDGLISETGVTLGPYTIDGESGSAKSGNIVQSKSDTSGSASVPLSLSAEGTFSQTQQFLTLFPKVRRLFRIHSLSISLHTDKVSAAIGVDAPYKKLPTAIGGPGSPLIPLSKKDEALLAEVEQFPNYASDLSKEFTPQLGSVPRDPFTQ